MYHDNQSLLYFNWVVYIYIYIYIYKFVYTYIYIYIYLYIYFNIPTSFCKYRVKVLRFDTICMVVQTLIISVSGVNCYAFGLYFMFMVYIFMLSLHFRCILCKTTQHANLLRKCTIALGHESMAEYYRRRLSGDELTFPCSYVVGFGESCNQLLDFSQVYHVANFSVDRRNEFEKKMIHNYTSKAKEIQRCPGCLNYCRRNKSNKQLCRLSDLQQRQHATFLVLLGVSRRVERSRS